jgi:hypothetical protein
MVSAACATEALAPATASDTLTAILFRNSLRCIDDPLCMEFGSGFRLQRFDIRLQWTMRIQHGPCQPDNALLAQPLSLIPASHRPALGQRRQGERIKLAHQSHNRTNCDRYPYFLRSLVRLCTELAA